MKKKLSLETFISLKNEYPKNKKLKFLNLFGLKILVKMKDVTQKQFTTMHYLIAMLRKYNINQIVASPGAQNAVFNLMVQDNPDFHIYSVVDERSAAYVASGISEELDVPVAITCTGATASRNYMSALTECFYRKVPVIAITFFNYDNNSHNLGAQFTDRSVSQNDIKALSVELPVLNNEHDKNRLLVQLNVALTTAIYKHQPVHINCPAPFSLSEAVDYLTLPTDFWTPEIYDEHNLVGLEEALSNKRVAILLGSHPKFKPDTAKALSDFAQRNNIPVLCDHTSNYHGANKIMARAAFFAGLTAPDVLIDIGNVTGEYSTGGFFIGAEHWRIADQDLLKCRYNHPIEKIFFCSELKFFSSIGQISNTENYYEFAKKTADSLNTNDLPLSMPLICKEFAKHVPANSSVHVSILNALRSMNFFDLPKDVDGSCNVGGFGIDGALSTAVGHCIASHDRNVYCIIGDLAFFYDMNILGNRHIFKNFKVILVNNYKGVEFRLNKSLEVPYGDKTNSIVAAAGHYKHGAKLWAESCDCHYMSASTKEEFLDQIEHFCKDDFDKPVFFEVFSNNEDEINAHEIIGNNTIHP